MTGKVLLRSPAIGQYKSSLKDEKLDAPRERRQFAEVAGGSAAECTAICCCCPLTVMNIVIFAVYKMPAGLCRKALNRRKRHGRMKKKRLVQQRRVASQDFTDGSEGPGGMGGFNHGPLPGTGAEPSPRAADDLVHLEEEMWGRFSQTGFWRSSSQTQTQTQRHE